MTPDASRHNPAPDYLRALVRRSGLTQRECARRIGISDRALRYFLADESGDHRVAPYPVQFALESLSRERAMLAVTDSDLGDDIGEAITCPRCGADHAIEYGEKVLPDGTREPSRLLAFYKCDGATYVAGLNGRLL